MTFDVKEWLEKYAKLYGPIASRDHIKTDYPEKIKLELNDDEEWVFNEIRKAIKTFSKPVVVRAAGGWVRDKVELFPFFDSLRVSPSFLWSCPPPLVRSPLRAACSI